jgi:hypothetical protein
MFTYAEAETVLAKLYAATGAPQRGAFRARLKTLKKFGIPLDSHPGKGKKIRYGYEQLYQWSLCLEMAQLGLDPTVVAKLIRERWALEFYKYFLWAEERLDCLSGVDHTPKDFYVMIFTELMSVGWNRREGAFAEKFPGLLDILPFDLNDCDANRELGRLRGDARRALILNFSETIRLIREAVMELGLSDRLPDHLRPGVPEAKAYERALANGARVSDGS